MMLDTATQFLQILQKYSGSYSPKNENISFVKVDFNSLRDDLKQIGITAEEAGARIVIEIRQLPFAFYGSRYEFESKINLKVFQKGLVVVWDYDGESIILDYKKRLTFDRRGEEVESESRKWFSFYDLVNILDEEAGRSNEVNSFIDYYEEFGKEYILIPKHHYQRIAIQFKKPQDISSIPDNIDSDITSLKKGLQESTNPFRIFLKNQIYTFLRDKSPGNRLYEFLSKLSKVISAAQLDYELYCSELSVEQLKKDYEEYKSKYFEHITDILSKVTNQVIALPITVLGAAFAIGKISDSSFALLLIGLAILGASSVVSYILYHYILDLSETKTQLEKDYDVLRASRFFANRQEELSDFNHARSGLNRKLTGTHRVMKIHFWLMAVFNAFLIGFIVFKIEIGESNALMAGFILLMVSAFLFNAYFKKL